VGVFGDAVQLYGDSRDAIPANDPVVACGRCENFSRRSKDLISISVCSCLGYVLFCRAQARIRASGAFCLFSFESFSLSFPEITQPV
jgi:hypothetical protein